MVYIPNTDNDRKKMLEAIGVGSFEDLLSPIPDDIRHSGQYDLPAGLSEMEVIALMKAIARKNRSAEESVSFLGAGAYDHYIPAVIGEILSRSEYYTAYTPYQAEVSQGTLQYIYEYQTMIAELMGMDVANASMYDGGSATAEAVLMACSQTRRSAVLVAPGVHPWYSDIIKTYCAGQEVGVTLLPEREGGLDPDDVNKSLDGTVGAVVFQYPNFFGCVEDYEEAGALAVVIADPVSMGILAPPGEWGADIVTAEGQSLGNALNFGGPYLGVFACRNDLVRRLPGRLIGRTIDRKGNPGYVMTLQTREQHIRREKATSNICTNQGLMALAATVYMTLMGKQGIQDVANLCLQKSHYLARKLGEVENLKCAFPKPFLKEFTLKTKPGTLERMLAEVRKQGFLPGVPLGQFGYPDHVLVAVTEKRTKSEMDAFAEAMKQAAGRG